MTKHMQRLALVVGFVLLASSARVRPASAFGVVGDGTPASCNETALRQAIGRGGLVTFNCGGPATIRLVSHTEIAIDDQPTIIDGGSQITISGDNATTIFSVATQSELQLHNITLSNGRAEFYGGAVYVADAGLLNATNSSFRDNYAGEAGSAIFAIGDAAINLRNCVVKGNQTPGYGAINSTGPILLEDSVLRDNISSAGGGALSVNGDVKILRSSFFYNEADGPSGEGGAILAGPAAFVTLQESDLIYNKAVWGGAVLNRGEIIFTDGNILGNTAARSGGGIYSSSREGNSHIVRVYRAMIRGNESSHDGGGMALRAGTADFANATFLDNHADYGGAIDASVTAVSLSYLTFSGNTASVAGANLNIDFFAQATAANILLDGEDGQDNCTVFNDADLISEGFNLSSDQSCAPYFTADGDMNGQKAYLDKLGDNGGPTRTLMPLGRSPAIDGGRCLSAFLDIDQRGAPRPAGAACDIGAVEYGGFAWQVYVPLARR